MASQSGMPPSMANMQPPYPPMAWALGGAPVKKVDIPAQTVFMVLFMIGAAVHMKIFQKNRARGHKFLPNLFIFAFCVSRVLTSILRLASVSNPRNIRLAIAAQIFVAAGVLILFVINIIFSMRLVRSLHPTLGWHPAFSIAFKFLCVLIGMTLIMVIAGTVQSFYTLDPVIKHRDRELQLYGSTFLAIIATLPLPITLISLVVPYSPPDRFGVGRLRTKVILLLISTIFLSLGAWYRCGSTWATPVPRSQPLPSYLSKGAFYVFNFLVEIQTVLMYAILRVDLRWHVPNGAHGPGSYSASKSPDAVEMQDSRATSLETTSSYHKHSTSKSLTLTIDTSLANARKKSLPTLDVEKAESIRSTHADPLASNPPRPKSLIQSLWNRTSNSSIVPTPPSFFTPPRATSPTTTTRPSTRRTWRTSEHERVVSRLGGPWQALASPEGVVRSPSAKSVAVSAVSGEGEMGASVVGASVGAGGGGSSSGEGEESWWRASALPPSLPDPMQGAFTPEVEWELRSPRRFLSMKRRVTRELI